MGLPVGTQKVVWQAKWLVIAKEVSSFNLNRTIVRVHNSTRRSVVAHINEFNLGRPVAFCVSLTQCVCVCARTCDAVYHTPRTHMCGKVVTIVLMQR